MNIYNTYLGKGRSATVYKIKKESKIIARKVFTGTDLTNLILTVFYGAPLDYQWNKAAVNTALYRRKALKCLLKFWFNNTIDIADTVSVGLKEDTVEYYLDTIFIQGNVANLHNAFSRTKITEYEDLRKILKKLQAFLKHSGMIGTVWQAGYGQPCAIPNFLKRNDGKWIWIDAESGVPAIVSYDLYKQIKFYIPQALKRRRILFDDLDENKFLLYLSENEKALKETLKDDYINFKFNVEALIKNHQEWGKENRFSRSLNYFLFKGRINKDNYLYYKDHYIKWNINLMKYFIKNDFPSLLSHIFRKIWHYTKKLNPIKYLKFTICSIFSRSYRIDISRQFVEDKIDVWYNLNRITDKEVNILKKELTEKESNQYLSDFGVFLLFKPLGYIVRIIVGVLSLPPYEFIPIEVAGIIIAFISISLRFLYASYRFIEDFLRYKRCSWISLMVSPIPVFGTLAYPCQMVHSARNGHEISKFMIYEIFSTIAKKIPIWGGYNSEIEYKFNNLAFSILTKIT